MKLNYKNIFFTQIRRTGLLLVSFLSVVCMAAGCGSEDKLLSGLHQEEETQSDESVSEMESDSLQAEQQDDSIEAMSGTGQETDVKALSDTDENAAPLIEEDQADAGKIYVHVCGEVESPGVYELPAGSRFYEAVEKAGGFTKEACQDYLNMAAPLADGSRLEIPALEDIKNREETEKADGGLDGDSEYNYYTVPKKAGVSPDGESIGNESDGLVNINTADMAELCSLPGIGEGRAKAIIEYREKQGGFQKKEDIMQVSGIGEKMYARMEAYLTVE